jgi:hypothetical protein
MMLSFSGVRRGLIGLAMLVFIAGGIAPAISAMSACAMPCCHHAAAPCPTKCTIGKAPVEIPAVASVNVQPIAPVVTARHAPAPRVVAVVIDDAPIPPHRPLHLVHSVFLI